MSLLLDTQVLLWVLASPGRLRPETRRLIIASAEVVFVSPISAWEIEIKRSLGKLRAPDDLDTQLGALRFTELPVQLRHVRALATLPPLHRDPFDRMLVAQALADGLLLVTADRIVQAYPARTIQA